MRRASLLLPLLFALACTRHDQPAERDASLRAAPPANKPHPSDQVDRYDALGLEPESDTGTAVGEYSVESGGPEMGEGTDSSVADTTATDSTAPRLMSASARPKKKNRPPIASFTAGCTGLKCVYRSTSRDPDGSVVKTLWSFPNGDAYTTLQVTRTYNEAGTYRVFLTVVDNLGAKDDTTRTVKISGVVDSTILPPPPPTFPPTDTVVVPPPDTVYAKGKPFGAYNLLDAPTLAPFTLVVTQAPARYILPRLDDARIRGYKLILSLPAVSHNGPRWQESCCLRLVNGVPTFYRAGYDSVLATYNTPEIRAGLQKAYADGILIGLNVMDEPWVKGLGDGNTWGPEGTMTKARVDSLCAIHHRYFPGVPVGPSTSHMHWSTGDLKVCDIGFEQFSYRYVKQEGSVATWVKNAEALANRAGIKTVYSFNPVNGGTPDADALKPGIWDCKNEGGIKGQSTPNCAMTASQIVEVVKAVGPYGCGSTIYWRYDLENNAIATLKAGFADAASYLKTQYLKPCRVR